MATEILVDWKNQVVCVKHRKQHRRPQLLFSIHYRGLTFKGKNIMSFLLPDDRSAVVEVSATDAKGFAAQLEGLAFTSSNEEIATVSADGVITPVAPGIVQINVTADALIGEGEAPLIGLLEIEVVAGTAVNLVVNAQLV